MTRTTKPKTEKATRAPALDDPALVAAKKAAEAAAAFNAFAGDETSPEWVAVEKRTTEADAAFANALVTSAAGALAKMEELRATVMSPSIDPDETYLDARHFNTVVAFLEGAPAPAPKPDRVVTMAAEWGAIQDEMSVLSAANPENKSGENMDRWEAALERLRALEYRIIKTPATSIAGVALKLRIASHYECDGFDLADFHTIPAREIDYDEAFGGHVRWETNPVILALLDAERLAGSS